MVPGLKSGAVMPPISWSVAYSTAATRSPNSTWVVVVSTPSGLRCVYARMAAARSESQSATALRIESSSAISGEAVGANVGANVVVDADVGSCVGSEDVGAIVGSGVVPGVVCGVGSPVSVISQGHKAAPVVAAPPTTQGYRRATWMVKASETLLIGTAAV